MPEYVRVADLETGHHVSIPKARYEASESAYRLLKSEAAYPDGSPRPPKHKTDVSTEAAKKNSGQQADTSKEK